MITTWKKKRLKFVAPSRRQILSTRPKGTRYIGLENIESCTGRLLLDTEQEQVDSSVVAFDERSVLFGKLRPYLAKVATPDFCGVASTEIMVFETADGNDRRFLSYSLLSDEFIKRVSGMTDGAKMPRANPDDVRNLLLCIPKPDEQRIISQYLDEATGKVDRLMILRRRQMELLREQRAAFIQQAVTRGLNANVSLRDSTLPWLGDIPRHWDIMPLKRWVSTRITDGPHETPELVSSGIDFVSAEAVQDGRLNFNSRRGFITEALHAEYCRKCKPQRDDIFMVKSGATTGKLAIVDTDHEFSVWSPLALIRVDSNKILPRFMFEALQTRYVFGQVEATWSYGTQPNIGMAVIERLMVTAPPIHEQRQILASILSESTKIDRLLSVYARQLELLTEYRAALIHECVTGQRAVTLEASIQPKQSGANVHFRRAVLGAEIIHRLHSDARFGRVKLEKIIYLSEAFAGIDLEGHYQRAAAGPFDNRALRSVETQIQKQKWYKPVKKDKGTRYLPLEKAGGHQPYFERYWPEQRPRFERIIELLRSRVTRDCEIIATLFAVWRDRLVANQPIADDTLVDEVLTNWHPSKQKIPRSSWLSGLKWMRANQLIPSKQPVGVQK